MRVHITGEGAEEKLGFVVKGRSVKFKGFTAVYTSTAEAADDDRQNELDTLPDLNEGERLDLNDVTSEQKFTKPPARYNDATLVKAMEENGIGRPSTYASIISVLARREYTEKENKFIKPTQLGEIVCDYMEKNFPDIMSLNFTARLEGALDKVADGGQQWQELIGAFYRGCRSSSTAHTIPAADVCPTRRATWCATSAARRWSSRTANTANSSHAQLSGVQEHQAHRRSGGQVSQMRRRRGEKDEQGGQSVLWLRQLSEVRFHVLGSARAQALSRLRRRDARFRQGGEADLRLHEQGVRTPRGGAAGRRGQMKPTVTVVGGGLAGCEAALQLLGRGFGVKMYEMRPVRMTGAHSTDGLAELVCSNSLKSEAERPHLALLKRNSTRWGACCCA